MTDKGSRQPRAFLIRAGRHGERGAFAIENGLSGGGKGNIPDLTQATSREAVRNVISKAWLGAKTGTIANHTGQMWTLRNKIRKGDLVVMPLKTTSQIALGLVTEEYRYREDEDPDKRHVVSVDWQRTDLPRTAVKQDLLFSLGAATTICSIRRNDGAWRLHQLLKEGRDPGSRGGAPTKTDDSETDSDDLEPDSHFDLEQIGRDRIQGFIAENFAGHNLSRLVAAVLEAEGFKTQVSPPGPDSGIDVIAGRGPLGLDSPRLIVQVKSGPSQIGTRVVQQLNGVVAGQNADQGLLVAWGGVTNPARYAIKASNFGIRMWDADQLIDAVLKNYDQLGDEWRADLPLKRVWTLIKEEEE